jgi:hypothetical protein
MLFALALGCLLSARAGEAKTPGKPAEPISFSKQVLPLLNRYCNSCHYGSKPKGNLALDTFKTDADALKDLNIWDAVAQRVRNHEMPPSRRRQPSAEEVNTLITWIDQSLGSGDCQSVKDPGCVTLRRLNRTEYNNTIRDLVGVDVQPAEDFPADDVGYGFDNIGDVLSLSPLLFEKYLAAAEKIVAKAMATPTARKRIFIAQPSDKSKVDECARKILENFARHAYRRPLAPEEVNRLAGLAHVATSQGDSFDKGIELALEAVLTSPQFLFRVERDRGPNRLLPHLINEYELATRLSYFLWSSMPDEELFSLAKKDALRKNLEAQVKRMLADPKALALVENFAGQWLQLRNLKTASPDPDLFPTFDDELRLAMARETELFFAAIMKDDRSILDFIDADYTFANERLARHYGIPGVQGEQFRRVTLSNHDRGGVLTQASVLTVTSNPTRTSPVKRGKFILENVLGTPPPPPPANVPELSEDKKVVLSGTLRQRMVQHRADPNCATCHQRMDPLGFGFENFDAVGAWRDKDGPFSVDPSGVLPSGQSFQGPAGLKTILKGQQDLFARCLTEKMLTYALGRGLEPYDKCTVQEIAAAVARNQYRFSSLVVEIVKSDPFQKRKFKGNKK